MSKILIVAAHPDDEVLGCAGTMARKISEGHEVFSIILGRGVVSRFNGQISRDVVATAIADLNQSISSVANHIGFSDTWVYDFPDNRFDSVDLLDIIKTIEKVKDEVRPDSVYTHFCNDLNIDHSITHRAVLTACRPMPDETVKNIYSFESRSSTEWMYNSQSQFKPNKFVNIGEFIDIKMDALKLYESEMRPYPHPRSLEAVKILSQYRGSCVGVEFAEAFELVRSIER